ILGALGRGLRADGESRDAERSLPMCRTDAVRTGVAATEDHDVLSGRRDLLREIIPRTLAVLLGKVLHGEVDAREFAARAGQVAACVRTGRNDDSVVAGAKVVPADVDTDVHARAKAGALGLQLAQAVVEMLLL